MFLQADDTPANRERQNIAKLAGVDKLSAWERVSLIDRYAQAYGVLPRIARQEKMGDVVPMLALWQQQQNYQERYRQVENELKPKP